MVLSASSRPAESWLVPYLPSELRRAVVWGEPPSAIPGQADILRFDAATSPSAAWPADPARPLEIESGSQDLFLALDFLEHLRMDELYMVLAEARRALRPKGICALRALSYPPGRTGRLAAKCWNSVREKKPAWLGGRRALELTHYISPEDWRTVAEFRFPEKLLLSRQTLLLERT